MLAITGILIIALTITQLGFALNDVLLQVKDTNNQDVNARCVTLDANQNTVDNRLATQFPDGNYGCNIDVPGTGLYTTQVFCMQDSGIRESKKYTAYTGTICIGDLGYSICEGSGVTLSCPKPTTTTTTTQPDDTTTTTLDMPDECTYNSDCGDSGYVGDKYCSEGDVRRIYVSYDCDNNVCSSTETNMLIDGCSSSETCLQGECVRDTTTTTTIPGDVCDLDGVCEPTDGEDESNCPDCLEDVDDNKLLMALFVVGLLLVAWRLVKK